MKIGKLFLGKQPQEIKIKAAKEERVNTKDRIIIIEEDERKSQVALHNVEKALEVLRTEVPVALISDSFDIMEFGISEQPAYIVNGKILSKGRMLTTADLVQLLHNYL